MLLVKLHSDVLLVEALGNTRLVHKRIGEPRSRSVTALGDDATVP